MTNSPLSSPDTYSTAPSSPSELSDVSSVTATVVDETDWVDFGSLPRDLRYHFFDLFLINFRLRVSSRLRAARVDWNEGSSTASPQPSNASVSSLDLSDVAPPYEPEPETEYADAQVQTNLVAANTTEDLSLLTQDLPADFWDDDLSESGEFGGRERVGEYEYAEECLREWFQIASL